ncbi:cytochrome c oxidase subunit 2A [Sutcliffiella cohnii]|uniref:Subunit I/II of b(O/a)3-type cytochrome C oxidase n=1 Tax=Sutcliffiella cohnii TaxID=33932 RepID=A0A223KQ60_9BACI|nr:MULTISPECIES: cytochrome c oxidase subunit 2A [Sutcliffiella]AST91641.1 subunit I/II of b(o/a)3-type cytochrome C oxidase [Sutcliffiella cohnii]MED4014772.1 cytochrome c oxidase subunit 2A [Sutcliffiella cohnii]WBL12859.1 cytochrome c oxidase subunit 2A [Sutcliffiella sp. NC1]
MAKPELVKKTVVKTEKPSNLRGTLVSVFILGGFLIITWFGVYFLFLSRI